MRPLLAPLLLLVGCADGPAGPPVASDAFLGVEHAVARPAPAGGVSALYLDLVNPTAEADTLVSVRAEAAERAVVHRTVDRGGGMTGMEPVGAVPVPAAATVSMAPGGLHVMLLGLGAPLVAGDSLDVVLELAARGDLALRVPIRLDP